VASDPTSWAACYEREPYRQALEVRVLRVDRDGDRPFAVLDDTLLFPEGGGQPADRGRLGEVAVVDVQKTAGAAGEIRHFLAAPVPPGPARLLLDWDRRYDLMQQHTAQHLLSAIAADRFGWPTTSFHLGGKISDVELDVPALDTAHLAALEDAVAVEIRAARAVGARRVSFEEYAALGDRVRSRGLPDGHAGTVRLVEIAGLDLNTCGGTHLRSTAEIEAMKLLGTERLRGGTRLTWVAGARVRRRLGWREEQATALRSLLGGSDEDLIEVAARKAERLEEAERRQRGLVRELAAAAAEALLAGGERVLTRHYQGRDAAFLQEIARTIAAVEGPRLALLTAGEPGSLAFVLASTTSTGVDLRSLGARTAELLGGRGGGAGTVYQGKATSLARAAEARELLERALERPDRTAAPT
jgi:Ser-tRNA(Ala) deacylase AlaX